MRFHLLAACLASLLILSTPSTANESNHTSSYEPIVKALVQPALRLELKETAQGGLAPLKLLHGYRVAHLAKGAPYALRLTNTSLERVMVVVALGGRDPFTGKKAYRGQKGRVIEPGETLAVSEYREGKKSVRPLFENQPDRSSVDVAVFYERTDYPLILPGMDTPPFGRENYAVGADGKRRWMPPKGYPFRKRSEEPSSFVHLPYTLLPATAGETALITP